MVDFIDGGVGGGKLSAAAARDMVFFFAREGESYRRGAARFDNKESIHILSADSRFPDLTPGRQKSNGNHFPPIG